MPAILVTLGGLIAPILRSAYANTELDRAFLLDTVGALRTQDNVDGLFVEYVQAAYKGYFNRTSRFIFHDLSQADSVLARSKIPYSKLLEDPKILLQISRSARIQTLLRTKIRKEGPQYRVTIDWLNAPRMDLLASETFVLPEGNELESARGELQKGLARTLDKVPWRGHVTGRDAEAVTVNMGSNFNIGPGDELIVGTLDEAKRHPLLNAIVDWRLSRTGRLLVENVDEKIAFCKVIEEEPGRQISRNQKILEVLAKPAPINPRGRGGSRYRGEMSGNAESTGHDDASVSVDEEQPTLDRVPRLGRVSAGLALGKFSRDYNSGASTGFSGTNGLMGARLDGQLWITADFFGDLGLGFNSGSYAQVARPAVAGPPAVDVSSGLTRFHLDLGYTLFGSLATQDAPRAWFKGGYKSDAYDLPFSQSELTSPLSFKSLFIGFGGDLPIRGAFGARVDLAFGLFNSVGESGLNSGESIGTSNVEAKFGAYYRFRPRLIGKLDLEVLSQNVDFVGNNSTSHRTFAFVPAVEFYF